jgi:hypothetical protein
MEDISMKPKTRIRILCCLTLAALASACTANRYLVPVTTFRDKTQQTIGVLGDFYSSRNIYEIDLYLQGAAADKSVQVATVDRAGKPTPLGRPVFSPASIKARLDALSLVSTYAGRLYDLASTDAPATLQTAATSLGENLKSLDKTFQSLEGAKDPTANKYITPVSSLIGAIGKLYLENKRDQLIKEGVAKGCAPVNEILGLIRDDMDKIFSLEVVGGSNERLATLIVAYNDSRDRLTYEQRVARLAEIKNAAAEAAVSVSAAPTAVVVSMINAHEALITAVQSTSKTKIANFAALSVALEQWANQIESLAIQIKALIH